MEDKNVQIRKIKDRIKSLTAAFSALKQENTELKTRNAELARQLSEHDKKMEEIQNKNINLQVSRALGKGGAGETDLRHRLDEYIGEIEAVIAHLKD
jgi:predicted nuclease with TOPRIM domain